MVVRPFNPGDDGDVRTLKVYEAVPEVPSAVTRRVTDLNQCIGSWQHLVVGAGKRVDREGDLGVQPPLKPRTASLV
jgi:hypothetical protein